MNEQELKRLLELREADDLTDEEQRELTGLETKLRSAGTTSEPESVAPTADEIRSIVSDVLGAKKKEKREAPEINADTEVRAEENYEHDWRHRVVRYFNALAIGKEDQAESMRLINDLRREVKDSVSQQQLQAEEREAMDTIKQSPLDNYKRSMARLAVGVGEARLMTTSTSDTPKAGYLLPKPFLAEVFVLIEQYGVARRLFRGIPMTSNSMDLKNLTTKVVAAWTDEGSNITADDLVLGEGALDAKKLAGLTSWTTELSEDQAIALLPVVQQSFAESMAEKEDQAAFLGDGTATYGGFTGLLNLTNAKTEVFATGSTAGSDITEANIRAAKASVSTASRMGARWFMEYSVLDKVSQLENTAGNRLFAGAFSNGQPGTILGDPVELVDVMPKLSNVAADTPFIAYGNPNRALFGTRRGMTADIAREAVVQDGAGNIVFNAFQADGAILRLSQRLGIKVPAAFEPAFAVIKTAAS